MSEKIFLGDTKFCKKCQAETERSKSWQCKPCLKVSATDWRLVNSEKVKASNYAWRIANIEKIEKARATSDTHCTTQFCKKCEIETDRYKDGRCKPCKSVADAASHLANPEKARAAAAAWRLAHPEQAKVTRNAWRADHPGVLRIHRQNRKARERSDGGALSPDLAARLYKLQNGLCACCQKSLNGSYHLDHIMPLKLGGSNTDNNIQLLLPGCNQKKGSKHPDDFMRESLPQIGC